jgi:hypothetical protein
MAAGIELVFAGPSGPTLKKGPYAAFCLQGETLREKVGAEPIAVHEDHHWQLEGRTFSRLDCDCRITIHLTRVDGKLSQTYGPFESFSCMDGVAYVDHELFAFADRSIGDWYCHADGRHWAIIVIEATPL